MSGPGSRCALGISGPDTSHSAFDVPCLGRTRPLRDRGDVPAPGRDTHPGRPIVSLLPSIRACSHPAHWWEAWRARLLQGLLLTSLSWVMVRLPTRGYGSGSRDPRFSSVHTSSGGERVRERKRVRARAVLCLRFPLAHIVPREKISRT